MVNGDRFTGLVSSVVSVAGQCSNLLLSCLAMISVVRPVASKAKFYGVAKLTSSIEPQEIQ